MRTLSYRRIGSLIRHASLVIELLVVLPCLAASAVTFTSDTAIASYDTNYDGLDITVTNCTVTVDGVHSFASLQVLGGGAVTHSAGEDGTIHNWFVVSNELQVLSATNVAVLSNANVVLASVVVQDLSGQITYSNGVDYTLGSAGRQLDYPCAHADIRHCRGQHQPGELPVLHDCGGGFEPDGDRGCRGRTGRSDLRRRQRLHQWAGAWTWQRFRFPHDGQRRRPRRLWRAGRIEPVGSRAGRLTM